MRTELLYHWAKFHKMNNLEKRELFTTLVLERFQRGCEAHIYRVLTRLTFQSLRQKYGEIYNFTKDEEQFNILMKELGLSSSTALNWYYATINKNPLKLVENECADLPTGNICECCLDDKIKEKLKNNYEFKLASKRLYQTIIKTELFKDELLKQNVSLDNKEIARRLRQIVEHDYYRKNYQLEGKTVIINLILERMNVRAITVLKWFYLIRDHPELLKQVYQNEISPDEVFEKSGQKLSNELRGDLNANCNVCQ